MVNNIITQQSETEMSEEEFAALAPNVRRACRDCDHLISAVSWWCGCKEAIEYRGTSIPGVSNCKFWKPMLEKPVKPPFRFWRWSFGG